MNLIHLTSKSQVNEVLRSVKEDSFSILFVSPWCKWSDKILELSESSSNNSPMYVINSWDTPEAFGTYKIMSAPSILVSSQGSLKIITEYSSVYNFIVGNKVRDYSDAGTPNSRSV